MKYSKIHIIILCFLMQLFAWEILQAAGTAGTSGADFLELGIGSRALSMGEAFTAETNDLSVIYYNPAGLGSMSHPMLSVMHQELIMDSRLENINFCYPIYKGFLGVSNTIFWVPPFDKIDINGNKTGDVVFMNGAFTVGYGYDLEFMYVGASMKYVYQKIDTLFINSVAFDLGVTKGMYMYSPFDAPIRNLHLGLSILNLGSGAKDNPLPRMLRMGLAYKLTNWFGINMDFTEDIISASDLYDFSYGFDESFRVNIGAEVSYLDVIALRAGYQVNEGNRLTMGIGFNYVIQNVAFNIDTSYADSGIFGPTYSITMSFKLIPKIVTYEDRIEAQSHYKMGIKYFVSNDLEAAINEFKLTRDYDPYYKNIDRKIEDLREIQNLMQENQKLEEEIQKQQ
ncbi:MAG: hypothetical protein CVV44_23460 [Spirochaetae bacterium HGW-Spirochaetae-1]|nr:MAG: hypothetical protein CVV44_23460 [Spirochaetae bacterium HGW-Spirochaetae-1]